MSLESSLEDISSLISSIIGPDSDAINRFRGKEGLKFDGIKVRINELQILLEEVAKIEDFENPQELTQHIQTVFSSIDSILKFISDIKNRLSLLNQEIERRAPKKFGGFFRSKESTPQPLAEIAYDTDNLMELYGIKSM